MTAFEEIHRSVTDAADIEQVHELEIPLGEVLRSLVSHPLQIITRWNWKSALIGACLRASFYFTVYQAARENMRAALTAAGVELAFRFFTSGASGSIVQSFRHAAPAWLATLFVTITLPIISHAVEYITHYVQEVYFHGILPGSQNNGRQWAFAFSVLFSALSAMFNLFAMRHGVLLVGAGPETKSLWSDFKKIPILVWEFLTYLPLLIIRLAGEQKLAHAAGIMVLFAISIGSVLGLFRGKWSWAWAASIGAFATLFVWTVMVAIGSRILNKRGRD
ncbi:MAG: hypothetical protein IT174_14665 [Acidobacteria bacterium]|nr:hypothetical protein [Acidobacteriota bacterium]